MDVNRRTRHNSVQLFGLLDAKPPHSILSSRVAGFNLLARIESATKPRKVELRQSNKVKSNDCDDSTELLMECRRFAVERITHAAPDGSRLVRDVVRHPGSVVILPLLGDDRVCLIRNRRIAVGETLIELPAGTRETGEAPELTAERELIEETGYRAAKIERTTSFFAAPGILDEEMILYTATGLTAGDPEREVGEEIENFVVSREQAMQMVADGTIRDAKTLVGLMWWNQLRVES